MTYYTHHFNKTPCRCKKCWARRTLNRHPEQYLKVPACSCGHRDWYVDNYRITVEWGKSGIERCDCAGYQFPHRKGGGWCFHNPELDLSDDEMYQENLRRKI